MTYKLSTYLRAAKTYNFTSGREENTLTEFEKKEFTVLFGTKT
jgi:hypothetical protein